MTFEFYLIKNDIKNKIKSYKERGLFKKGSSLIMEIVILTTLYFICKYTIFNSDLFMDKMIDDANSTHEFTVNQKSNSYYITTIKDSILNITCKSNNITKPAEILGSTTGVGYYTPLKETDLNVVCDFIDEMNSSTAFNFYYVYLSYNNETSNVTNIVNYTITVNETKK